MGGLTAQILLDRGLGAAGVSFDGATPKGIYRLPLSAIKAANPVLSNPLNYKHTIMLTFKQFRYAFAHVMTEQDARSAYDNDVVPGPGVRSSKWLLEISACTPPTRSNIATMSARLYC